jgi:ABC-type polysaccharide/polyol phosphate transport system ATPase subunit
VSAAPDAEPAVLVEGVAKRFFMPSERVHTLKERALHPLRRRGGTDIVALRDVSFSVQPGEFFGIVGRNGSGKSTLLKCLGGIYAVDRGRIAVRGRMSTFIELGVGFNPDLAAADNIVINGIMLGLTPREARRRVGAVLEFAELERFADLKLKNYSSGMHVRLAFSVMIQVDADVLLIDEVLAVGDAAFQQKCFDEFHRIRDEGRTVLFVTHDMSAIRRFCHRALLLEHGRVRLIGEPERVGDHYMELNFGRDHLAGEAEDEGYEAERFGDRSAEIAEAWFEDAAGQRTDVIRHGEPCRLCVRVLFNKKVDPNFAVLIEDELHHPLFVTSAADADCLPGPQTAGEELVFAVSFDALFAPGRIYVTPWLVHGGGAELIDRRPRMLSAVVIGRRMTGGLVDLPHDMAVMTVAPSSSSERRA